MTKILFFVSFVWFRMMTCSSFSDMDALLKMKDSMKGHKAKDDALSDWKFSASLSAHCSFSGVECDQDLRVVAINVSSVSLFGHLPPEIGQFDKLQNLTISQDNLTGELPKELAALTSLKLLNILLGKVRICKPWRTWKSPELISVSPLAIVSGQETSISLKGRNLSTPGTKIHCTGTGSYSSAEVIRSSYPGVMYDNIKLSGFKVQDVSPGVVGRFFIEIENGFKGNSFPVIIADETICEELRPLESEFNEEEKICDAISEEHEHHFGRPRSREEALHFLNELGWLFQRERFSYVHEVPCYSLDRFKFVLTFAVERNCCMLVKTLLDVLVDKHLQGESLSTVSVEMLNAIQLLNRAVKRKNIGMVDLLIHYSLPDKNSTSRKYVFPPNLEGSAGITPLHLAACTAGSESVVDSLTSDPQEIGLKCWESLVDANGQTPHAYAIMRNNNSYNVLVARKLADRRRAEISVTIENEIEQASLRVELNQKQSNLLKRGQSSCAKCATAEIRYNRRVPGSQGLLHRPFIYSMLAVAAVCVCVCVFFRGRPCVGSVAPFSWETLDFGTM